jgi:hypothetical protein
MWYVSAVGLPHCSSTRTQFMQPFSSRSVPQQAELEIAFQTIPNSCARWFRYASNSSISSVIAIARSLHYFMLPGIVFYRRCKIKASVREAKKLARDAHGRRRRSEVLRAGGQERIEEGASFGRRFRDRPPTVQGFR